MIAGCDISLCDNAIIAKKMKTYHYFLCDGGIKWSGRMLGSSLPSILTFIKCIERANSSISRNPSQSTSDSFQIFDKTELGNFDLMSSDLAAKNRFETIFYSRLLKQKV